MCYQFGGGVLYMRALIIPFLLAPIAAFAGGPSLSTAGDCPGPIAVSASGLTPGGMAAVLKGSGPGSDVMPAGPCAGDASGLSGLAYVTMVPIDGAGNVNAMPTIAAPLCGNYVQFVDATSCMLTNTAILGGGDVGECENLGWKSGDGDWSCPPGMALPTLDQWDAVSACMTDEDMGMIDYYQNVGVEVGGCNCKWNADWCGQPSIETFDGRMCGDYAQLHICLPEGYAHDNGLGLVWYNAVPTGTINDAQAQASCEATYPGECEFRDGDCAGPGWCYTGDAGYEPCWGYEDGCSGEAGRVWEYGSSYDTYGYWN